jgi:predicted RNase H-related nuclease YkuK (DUF458 family)
MSPLTVQIRYRDGSTGFTAVSNKEEVISARKKLMDDGWMVMQNQTFLDNAVDQRQIEHNNVCIQSRNLQKLETNCLGCQAVSPC